MNGGKFPLIRQHLAENIGGVYKDMDLSFEFFLFLLLILLTPPEV